LRPPLCPKQEFCSGLLVVSGGMVPYFRMQRSLADWAGMKDFILTVLKYIPAYLTTWGAVFAGPKTFIAERRAQGEDELGNAFLFLAISTALLAVAGTLVQPGKDIWSAIAAAAITSAIAVALGATTIRISWWLVGGRANTEGFFVTYSYSFGVIIVIIGFFQFLGVGVFKVMDPALYAKVVEASAKNHTVPPDALESTVFWVVAEINAFGVIAAGLWAFVAWGAYRQLNGLSKTRSMYAFLIAGFLSFPITLLVFFVGQAIS
jgi:hypothetical protein